MIAQVEAYWNRRPCNVKHSAAPIGSLEWSRQVTTRKYFIEPHIKDFAQFEQWRGKKVLEIGCGIGTDTLSFLRAGADVDVVELSGESLELAKRRVRMEFPGQRMPVSWFHVDAEQMLPRWPGGYDLIYSFGVLHHTPNPAAVLKLARARLAKNGELRIMLYASGSIKYLTQQQPEAQSDCPIAIYYSIPQARKFIESCGFKIKSIQKDHIFPWDVREYVHYRYVKHWPYRIMSDRLFRWLESKLGHHLLVVAEKD
jgi:SAM-dependent methyltransferase